MKSKLGRKIRNLYDALFVPAIVCILFHCYKDTVTNYLIEPSTGQAREGHSVADGRSVKDEDDRYDQHSAYITDEFTDFRLNPHDCNQAYQFRHGKRQGKQPNVSNLYDALFLISSSAHNVFNRRIFRHIYSTFTNTRPYRIRTIFLVGRSVDPVVQANIEREAFQYGDTLQGNFIDHYYNLTYKTIMAYRWAKMYCKDVKLILKMDDDVYLDIFKFFDHFLPIVPHRSRMIYGFLNFHPRVFRDGKYRVAETEYSGHHYPNFCSGFFVVPTLDVIDGIYELSKTVKYFRLEDVFTYGLTRERMIDVQLTHLDVITYEHIDYERCVEKYSYRCKYMAVECSPHDLLKHFENAMEFRRKLGLPGGYVET